MANSQPQAQFKNNQTTINLDVFEMFNQYIVPIDSRRVTYSGNFIESRCHAYFRIIGFPVLAKSGNMYSPGFDPNLNTSTNGRNTNKNIDSEVLADTNFVNQQFDPREQRVKSYVKMFANSGFNAAGTVLGSIFIRSFDKQFLDAPGPLDFDPQSQVITERINVLTKFYQNQPEAFGQLQATGYLKSLHLLKPFIVDPRIVNKINNNNKMVGAPFLFSNQLNTFPSGGKEIGSIKRPFIEQVISLRFNNANLTNIASFPQSDIINTLVNDIKDDPDNLDADLNKLAANPTDQLQNSDINIFNDYVNKLLALIDQLINALQNVSMIRSKINFQPIPNITGIENGATMNDPIQGDTNNKEQENNILSLQQDTIVSDVSTLLDAGTSGVPDPNSFIFPNPGDTVFNANKSNPNSIQEHLTSAQNERTKLGNDGIRDLQIIEMIMGEFSGLGLIDVIAIQAAFWLMDKDNLIGLIDNLSFTRALDSRPDLNLQGVSSTLSAIDALTSYETAIKNVYKLIQYYFDQKMKGKFFITP